MAESTSMGIILPENGLEQRIVDDDFYRVAVLLGRPRSGHPEGTLGKHVEMILAAIPHDHPDRSTLRVCALLHDVGKLGSVEKRQESYLPDDELQRSTLLSAGRVFAARYPSNGDWHVPNHAERSWRYAQQFGLDRRTLQVIKYHDTGHSFWANDRYKSYCRVEPADALFDKVFSDIDLPLLLSFAYADSNARGKGPVRWLERKLLSRCLLSAPVLPAEAPPPRG